MADRSSDIVTDYRQAVTNAWKALGDLTLIDREVRARAYPGSLVPEGEGVPPIAVDPPKLAAALGAGALDGRNADITIEKLANAMTSSNGILAGLSEEARAALALVRL